MFCGELLDFPHHPLGPQCLPLTTLHLAGTGRKKEKMEDHEEGVQGPGLKKYASFCPILQPKVSHRAPPNCKWGLGSKIRKEKRVWLTWILGNPILSTVLSKSDHQVTRCRQGLYPCAKSQGKNLPRSQAQAQSVEAPTPTTLIDITALPPGKTPLLPIVQCPCNRSQKA